MKCRVGKLSLSLEARSPIRTQLGFHTLLLIKGGWKILTLCRLACGIRSNGAVPRTGWSGAICWLKTVTESIIPDRTIKRFVFRQHRGRHNSPCCRCCPCCPYCPYCPWLCLPLPRNKIILAFLWFLLRFFLILRALLVGLFKVQYLSIGCSLVTKPSHFGNYSGRTISFL